MGLMNKMQGKKKGPEGTANSDDNSNTMTDETTPSQSMPNYDDFKAPTETKPEPKKETPKPQDKRPEVVQKKEVATKLFKDKKFEEAIEQYSLCQELDPKDKVYTSNIIACLIELKKFEDALNKCTEVIKIFDEDQVDFKVRARILQRKGTIHTSLKQYKEAVEA